MQKKLFYNLTKEMFAPAWADYINNQNQIEMKKKKAAIKAKKRIRLQIECKSIAEKEALTRVVINAKKRMK